MEITDQQEVIDYLNEPLENVLWAIQDIFNKKRYPRTVKLQIKKMGGTNEWAEYIIEMNNSKRWLRYKLKVLAYPPTTPAYPDYSILIKIKLISTFDLYVQKKDIDYTEKEYTTRKSLVGYSFQTEFKKPLRYWQALVQMSWVDVSLFALLKHRLDKLLRKLGMDR